MNTFLFEQTGGWTTGYHEASLVMSCVSLMLLVMPRDVLMTLFLCSVWQEEDSDIEGNSCRAPHLRPW